MVQRRGLRKTQLNWEVHGREQRVQHQDRNGLTALAGTYVPQLVVRMPEALTELPGFDTLDIDRTCSLLVNLPSSIPTFGATEGSGDFQV